MGRKVRKVHSEVVRTFGQNLKAIRKRQGLSQIRLALNAGINISYLGRLERSEAAPGIDMVGRIAESLGVDLAELLAPTGATVETVPVLKRRAKENIDKALDLADRPVLEMFSVMGSLAANALSRRR